MTVASQHEATAIHAVPAQFLERGFRLLVLREHHTDKEPAAFAWMEQRLLRTPQRLTRHGIYFGRAFLPEITAWLIEHVGRPSLRESGEKPNRNSLWPVTTWHSEPRQWRGGIRTTEWFIDVTFRDEAAWSAFRERWHGRLMGEIEPARP
jgi:hypothetical protein